MEHKQKDDITRSTGHDDSRTGCKAKQAKQAKQAKRDEFEKYWPDFQKYCNRKEG